MKKLLFVVSLIWDQIKFSLSNMLKRDSVSIHLKAEGSSAFPSKALFEMIQRDHPDDTEYYVLFTKIVLDRTGQRRYHYHYAFFVNPQWKKHDVKDPKKIMTQQMVKQDGRIGFHTYQPTVHEIFNTYAIKEDNATIKVTRAVLNGEPYYILERP